MKKIKFPYKKYFLKEPVFYYNNIINFKPSYHNTNTYYVDGIDRYYYDIIVDYSNSTYDTIDVFTDYFNEKARVEANVKNTISPLEYYHQNEKKILNMFSDVESIKERIYQMREYIYLNTKETTLFKISSILSLFDYVSKDRKINMKDMRVLDPSSGWGDRLIAFVSMNVKEYIGFDPNPKLQKGYNKIINTITKFTKSKNNYTVNKKGFEYCKYDNYFDIVFTSPPYFDVEEYVNDKNQSIKKYNNFEKWKNVFFKKYIENCVKAVKPGGLIFIHIANNRDFKIVKFLMDEMKKYNVSKYKYIGLEGSRNFAFPIWSWVKH